ncbi:MAG: ATP-binding cassette domain-containing protein [Chloroflexi bacterium]|nr:ATP-binding cassette domain-containing protein [Chloroflexota bacterium]
MNEAQEKGPASDTPTGQGRQAEVPRLRPSGVSESFPGVQALTDVALEVAPREIHALVGENGAGKSILMNIVAAAAQNAGCSEEYVWISALSTLPLFVGRDHVILQNAGWFSAAGSGRRRLLAQMQDGITRERRPEHGARLSPGDEIAGSALPAHGVNPLHLELASRFAQVEQHKPPFGQVDDVHPTEVREAEVP